MKRQKQNRYNIKYENTCVIMSEGSQKKMTGTVIHFVPEIKLDVDIQGTNSRLNMKYNGKSYVQNVGGMTLMSNGPNYTEIDNG